jgi:hypothetical protein
MKELNEIKELGYINIREGKIINSIKPVYNIYENDFEIVKKYLNDYCKYHDDFEGEFFVCLYDGWREYSEYCEDSYRIYKKWHELEDKNLYLGNGTEKEPRFMHKNKNFNIYPELSLPILTYCRHLNDKNCLLIPDREFLVNNFNNYSEQVLKFDINWENKVDKFIWRGSKNISNGNLKYNHNNIIKHHRLMSNDISNSSVYGDVYSSSFEKMSIEDMLKYKYLMDIDGMVNAFSGLYWKMLSNSLVIKVKSHWEQWYYNELKEYEHYVPLENFYQIPYVYNILINNEEKSKIISENATKFAKKLTYEYAIKEYKIR